MKKTVQEGKVKIRRGVLTVRLLERGREVDEYTFEAADGLEADAGGVSLTQRLKSRLAEMLYERDGRVAARQKGGL